MGRASIGQENHVELGYLRSKQGILNRGGGSMIGLNWHFKGPHWLLPGEGQEGSSASRKGGTQGRRQVEVGTAWLLLFAWKSLFSKCHFSRGLGTSRPQGGPP